MRNGRIACARRKGCHLKARDVGDVPYRVVRHPSYLGALLAIVGIAVMFGSWITMIAGAAAMVAVYRRRILLEEVALETVHGAAYSAHRARTWCLLPGFW